MIVKSIMENMELRALMSNYKIAEELIMEKGYLLKNLSYAASEQESFL